HARAYFVDRKTWSGDLRADLAGDSWQHTEPVVLGAPAALATPPDEPDPTTRTADDRVLDPVGRLADWLADDRYRLGAAGHRDDLRFTDPFLDEVAEVTRLRYDGAQVSVHPSAEAGRSYLVVAWRDEFGPVNRWPVGAVAGQVTALVLEAFVRDVHAPRRSADPNLRSHLVYGGPRPEEEVGAAALAAGVALHSLVA